MNDEPVRKINIKPCSEGSFGIVGRFFALIGGFVIGGWFVWIGFAETSTSSAQMMFVFATVLLAGGMYIAFTYTEWDVNRITKVFRVGRLLRFEYGTVHWEHVIDAVAFKSNNPNVSNLRLTTVSGACALFTVSQHVAGSARFYEIASHFRNR